MGISDLRSSLPTTREVAFDDTYLDCHVDDDCGDCDLHYREADKIRRACPSHILFRYYYILS